MSEQKLIAKSIETFQEINDPFKLQKQSPTLISRRLNIVNSSIANFGLGKQDLYRHPNKQIRLTMAIVSSKGIIYFK